MSLLLATSVVAAYDPVKQELELSAEVELNRVTYGIVFRPIHPWLGGYKFALDGFQTTPQKTPTKVTINRSVSIPEGRESLKEVIVSSLLFPDGEVIPVRWLGFNPEPPKEGSKERTAATKNLGPPVITTVVIKKVLDGGSFTIESRANDDFIYLEKFDERFLKLQNASIINGIIVWNFLTLVPGRTNVSVRAEKGLGGAVYVVEYIVDIYLPGIGGLSLTQQAGDSSETLSFLGKVNEVLKNVQETNPDAVVHSAKAVTHNLSGVDTIGALYDYFVTFQIPNSNQFEIKELIGEYIQQQTLYVPASYGVPDVKWPVGFQAEDALKQLRARGVTDAFTEVELTSTVFYGDNHFPPAPVYIFRLANGKLEPVQLLQDTKA
jgi:hypothetical protein